MVSKKLRIAFMGTPDFSIPPLQALIEAGHDIVAVYTQPPKPKDRGHQVKKTPIHEFAEATGIKVFHPKSLRTEEEQVKFRALNLDVAVVSAYGLILPKEILEVPKNGCLNIHFSLLPKWRGAAPIQRSIEAGDDKTGITIMQMDEGLDTGDILLIKETPITAKTTSATLVAELSKIGAELIVQAVLGQPAPQKQDNAASSYAKKITKEESFISWQMTAEDIDRKFRAFYPWPGISFAYKNEHVKIHQLNRVKEKGKVGEILSLDPVIVACDQGALQLDVLQRPNRPKMNAGDVLRGLQLKKGDFLL